MSEVPPVTSFLEIVNIETKVRRIVHQHDSLFEAPNWSRDSSYLIFNSNGLLYRISPTGGQPQRIPTGAANRNNNDHGISPDGKNLAISHFSDEHEGKSIIYVVPIEGGEPRQITRQGHSFWHSWSPDGSTLAFVAGRPWHERFKIYTIKVKGGGEKQITFTPGLDDGPDFSPCGRYIYYNSYQSGMMQIWRMDVDGNNPIQLVTSPHSDWFPHPSPDGKYLVFIRYMEDQVEDHPFGKDVKLMLLDLTTKQLRDLSNVFYGGQGTINVPSWAPSSKELAFVSYQKL